MTNSANLSDIFLRKIQNYLRSLNRWLYCTFRMYDVALMLTLIPHWFHIDSTLIQCFKIRLSGKCINERVTNTFYNLNKYSLQFGQKQPLPGLVLLTEIQQSGECINLTQRSRAAKAFIFPIATLVHSLTITQMNQVTV